MRFKTVIIYHTCHHFAEKWVAILTHLTKTKALHRKAHQKKTPTKQKSFKLATRYNLHFISDDGCAIFFGCSDAAMPPSHPDNVADPIPISPTHIIVSNPQNDLGLGFELKHNRCLRSDFQIFILRKQFLETIAKKHGCVLWSPDSGVH